MDGARVGVAFRLGGACPWADSGFRRACLWGEGWPTDGKRINGGRMCKWEWFRQAQPNGFGVGGLVPARVLGFGGRVCGGKERMKDEG